MTIKASDWYDSFDIEWADDAYQWNTDYRWRLKIMDGGMLLLQEKTKDGGFLRVAPHAWHV